MIDNRALPSATQPDSCTPAPSGPRWWIVEMTPVIRPCSTGWSSVVNPAMPHTDYKDSREAMLEVESCVLSPPPQSSWRASPRRSALNNRTGVASLASSIRTYLLCPGRQATATAVPKTRNALLAGSSPSSFTDCGHNTPTDAGLNPVPPTKGCPTRTECLTLCPAAV